MHTSERITIHHCTCSNPACGHKWTTKGDKLPRVCPKCTRATWDNDQPKSVAELLGRPLTETVGQDPPATELERLIVEDLIIPAVEPADQRAVLDQLKGYMAGKVPAEAIAVLPDADLSTVEEIPAELEVEPDLDAVTSFNDFPDNAPTIVSGFATPPLGKHALDQIAEEAEPKYEYSDEWSQIPKRHGR